MSFFNPSFLIGDIESRKKIDLLVKIKKYLNIALFLCLPILFIALAISASTGENQVAGMIALLIAAGLMTLVFLSLAVLSVILFLSVESMRKGQKLGTSERDCVLAELNKGYNLVVRATIISLVVSAILILLALVFIVVAALSESEKVVDLASMGSTTLIVLGIFICSFYALFKEIKFSQKYAKEVEFLTIEFGKEEGLSEEEIRAKRKKPSLFNNTETNRLLLYMYPDEQIRLKISKVSFVFIIPSVFGGFILGFSAVAFLSEEKQNLLAFFICLAIAVAMIGFSLAMNVLKQKKLRQEQRNLLLKDEEKNKLYLEHFDKTTEFQKNNNRLSLIFFGALVVIVAPFLIFSQVDIGAILGTIFLSLILWSIGTLVISAVQYKKHRASLSDVERELDKIIAMESSLNLNFEQPKDPFAEIDNVPPAEIDNVPPAEIDNAPPAEIDNAQPKEAAQQNLEQENVEKDAQKK